jgi:hypothetical protein
MSSILQLVVGHLDLGERHVHVFRHPPCDGDDVGDFTALCFEQFGHLGESVLGLRDGQTVAGDNDHPRGVGIRIAASGYVGTGADVHRVGEGADFRWPTASASAG